MVAQIQYTSSNAINATNAINAINATNATNAINATNATNAIQFQCCGQREKQGAALDHAPRIGRICGFNHGPVSARAVGI